MANRYDVKFLAAAIKANYLDERRAKALFDEFMSSGAVEQGNSIAVFALEKGYLSESQIDIIERVIGKEQAEEKKPAKKIGPYQPIAKLGSGAMGVVVKARHEQTGEIVALKVLPRRLYEDPEYIQRFVREATNASKLNHPNIMRALGVERTEDGLYYYAMEFIDGESVQSVLDRLGPIPESQAIAIAVRVCRALQHAQENGIIHRDIKPENIMVNRQGKVKLTDLGLAKEIVDTTVTQTGIALGTPHYMSPEQARGDRDIDTRGDIYSLGATLYHMLTGDPPFVGKSAAVVITKHLMEQVPSPKDVRPELSDGICMVIQRMMAKEPQDRYPTPNKVIEDLELVGRGEKPRLGGIEPNKTSVKSPQQQATRARERTRSPLGKKDAKQVLVPAISIVLSALLLGLALAIILRRPAQKSVAEPPDRPVPPQTTVASTIPEVTLLEKIEESIKDVQAFEAKHRDDPSRQDEIVARWERLLAPSRGTRLEKTIEEGLASAKQYREKALGTGGQPSQLDEEFLRIQQQVDPWLEKGEWLQALHAYDGLLAQNPSTSLAQRAVNEQKQVRQRVVQAAKASLARLRSALPGEGLKAAKDKYTELVALQLEELAQPLADFKGQIAAIEDEAVRETRARSRELRVELFGKVIRHVRGFAYEPAIREVQDLLGKAEAAPIVEELRTVQGHLTILLEMWRHVPDGARSLIGQTRKHLGFEGRVTGVQGEELILKSDQGQLAVPLKSLSPDEILSLALRGSEEKQPEAALRTALFRLYHQGEAAAQDALEKVNQAGVAMRPIEHVLSGLRMFEDESLAQKLFEKASQQLDGKEWQASLRALQELADSYGQTSFVRRKRQEIEDSRSLAGREGRPALFFGRRIDHADGTVELRYDFADPRQLLDWFPANLWAVAKGGLLLPHSNWLLHRGQFEHVSELSVELQSSEQPGLGLAHVGWALELQSLPGHLVRLTDLKSGLIGRFFAEGESKSSLFRAPAQVLLESSELRFEPGASYRLVVQRTTDSVRWSISGQDFLRYAGLPHCGGKRVAIFSVEAITHVRFAGITGRLDREWVAAAAETEQRREKTIREIQNGLGQNGAADLFPNGSLDAWFAPPDCWQAAEAEIRFLGGPDALPCRLPLPVSDASLSGRFKFQGGDKPGAWEVGFRLAGPLGYRLIFSAARETISLHKVIEAENSREPCQSAKLTEKAAIQFVPLSWHQFEVRFAGEQIQVSLDKDFLFMFQDPTYNSGELSVSGMAEAGPAGPVSFKDFKLRTRK